eukprot:NODE_537_length_1986_cov_18.788332_g429_i0.p1 GENE.NODE_537_length_1986_cov_18.788332_g429_i0~~NODE_537_length_1986_cov_18.788332_g429_i0.p1  ORF type:complete len:531 (-),score=41.73 NODE_537_length_1986_cov_18.788332_g429_i0:288-1880(-)
MSLHVLQSTPAEGGQDCRGAGPGSLKSSQDLLSQLKNQRTTAPPAFLAYLASNGPPAKAINGGGSNSAGLNGDSNGMAQPLVPPPAAGLMQNHLQAVPLAFRGTPPHPTGAPVLPQAPVVHMGLPISPSGMGRALALPSPAGDPSVPSPAASEVTVGSAPPTPSGDFGSNGVSRRKRGQPEHLWVVPFDAPPSGQPFWVRPERIAETAGSREAFASKDPKHSSRQCERYARAQTCPLGQGCPAIHCVLEQPAKKGIRTQRKVLGSACQTPATPSTPASPEMASPEPCSPEDKPPVRGPAIASAPLPDTTPRTPVPSEAEFLSKPPSPSLNMIISSAPEVELVPAAPLAPSPSGPAPARPSLRLPGRSDGPPAGLPKATPVSVSSSGSRPGSPGSSSLLQMGLESTSSRSPAPESSSDMPSLSAHTDGILGFMPAAGSAGHDNGPGRLLPKGITVSSPLKSLGGGPIGPSSNATESSSPLEPGIWSSPGGFLGRLGAASAPTKSPGPGQCDQCSGEIKPEFQFCPFCGAPR